MKKRPSHLRRLLSAAVQVSLILLVLQGLHLLQTRNTVTGLAPDFAALDIDGRPVALRDFQGQPVLVHFWATWCPVCRMEEQAIADLARDAQVVTIAIDDAPVQDVRSYLQRKGLDFRVIADPDGRLAALYGVTGVPASFILDGQGHIRFTEVGYTTGWGLRTRMMLAKWWDRNGAD